MAKILEYINYVYQTKGQILIGAIKYLKNIKKITKTMVYCLKTNYNHIFFRF